MGKNLPPRHSKQESPSSPDYTYEGLLRLSEDDLKAWFPHGARMTATKRWAPAERQRTTLIGYMTLRELLRAKKVKPERVRYLHANPGASGPRWKKDEDGKLVPDPSDDGKHDYTERVDKATPGEWTLDDETLEDFAKENNNRFDVIKAEELQRRKVRSLLGRLRTVAIAQTKAGSDPTPALEQAVENLEREQEAS